MTSATTKHSIKNIFWAYLSFVSTKGLNLVAVVLIARYLDPAEFGLMAICLAVMVYFDILSQFGLGSSLISVQDDVEETASAVLTCGIGLSAFLAGTLWLASSYIATFYEAPTLQDMLGITALALVIRSTTMVHSSFLYRELNLRAKLIPDVVRGLTKGVVSITLAVLGFGVWALVWGYLASAIAQSIALLVVRPWRPVAMPTRDSMRYVMGYGSNLIGAETINALPRILDNLLVGKILGTAALGIYSLAYRIPELGIKSFTTVTGSVLHPVMSMIQGEDAALRAYYYSSMRYCALIMFGVAAGIVVLAEPMIKVLYAPKWYDMIVPMQLVAISFAISTLNMVPGKLLKAVRRTDLLFRVSLWNLPFFVVVIWLAVPYGIVAVSAAQVLLAVLRFLPTYWVTKQVTDVSFRDTMASLAPGVFCSVAASLAAWAALQTSGEVIVQLVLGAVVFTMVYVVMLSVFAPEIIRMVMKKVARKRPAV